MGKRVSAHGLSVDSGLYQFVTDEVLPHIGVSSDTFWQGFAAGVADFSDRNRQLLAKREELQAKIDEWYIAHRPHGHKYGAGEAVKEYTDFLREIGYLQPEGDDFAITTKHTDDEIAHTPGPQLVVPVLNARFALNAANARWGSLYNVLYGSDVLGEVPKAAGFDTTRGKKAIAWVRAHFDKVMPLVDGSHADATGYAISDSDGALLVQLAGGKTTGLKYKTQLRGWRGDAKKPAEKLESILLAVNGLHLEIVLDASTPMGKLDPAGIADVMVEAALTTIVDLEDSIAAVDAEDKTKAYRNWLGLIMGDLTAKFQKDGKTLTRQLTPDRTYTGVDGKPLSLHGRSLLLVRNVGILTTNSAILDTDGNEVFEGIMDAFISSAIATIDVKNKGKYRNSRTGAIYIVKPKLHGPEEVAFSCAVFAAVEKTLGLSADTIKIGIMDEERRTSVNLKECIRAAKSRVMFINTGFLDRTGDEIHTAMESGAMIPKTAMKGTKWIAAYEDWNVDVGIACGLTNKAQIGKGMWAMPDRMAAMYKEKLVHVKAAANCAWVPSPTAAVLHALHYHEINPLGLQAQLAGKRRAQLDDLLTIPVDAAANYAPEDIQRELDNNAQGILGYVVRWIDQGIGCSKVPDINDVGLMEDRATLRISAQHMCNWLHHGLVTRDQVLATMQRMAKVVDKQNGDDPAYTPMTQDLEGSLAFQSAVALVLEGRVQPSGYTEPILHAMRVRQKQKVKG